MTGIIELPSVAPLGNASPPLDEVLRLNRITYDELAELYEKSGAERLIQAQRWLRPVLHSLRQAPRPLTVLELGSADGFLTGYISSLGHEVTAVEFADSMAAMTLRHAPQIQLVQEDFLTCGLSAGFDVIICSAFVHLFPAPWDRKVLEKVCDLMAPSGLAYLATTVHSRHTSGYELKDCGLGRYRTRFTVPTFSAVVQQAGLTTRTFYTTRDRLAPEKTWGNWLVRRGTS
jgi:SAM-dependent methyltransferase